MIETSLDWAECESKLLRKANKFSNGNDIKKMIKNINIQVTKLSKAEVSLRQGQKHATDALLSNINENIEMIEEYLIVAALIG